MCVLPEHDGATINSVIAADRSPNSGSRNSTHPSPEITQFTHIISTLRRLKSQENTLPPLDRLTPHSSDNPLLAKEL